MVLDIELKKERFESKIVWHIFMSNFECDRHLYVFNSKVDGVLIT